MSIFFLAHPVYSTVEAITLFNETFKRNKCYESSNNFDQLVNLVLSKSYKYLSNDYFFVINNV